LLTYLLAYLLTWILTYLLTYSMVQNPYWEANRFSDSQEIPPILGKQKVHYCIHNCPSPVPTLSHIDPVHSPTSHFLKIRLNIILPSTSGYTKWSLSLRFPRQNAVYASPLLHTRYMTRPSHSSRFYHPNIIRCGYRSLSTSLCSFFHTLVTSSLFYPNILLNTRFSDTLSLCSSLIVCDQVSRPYNTTGNIIS